MKTVGNPAAERAVLSGIVRNGADVFFDVVDLISEGTFTVAENHAVYSCIKKIYEQDDSATIDVTSLYTAAHELGISHIMEKTKTAEHIQSIFNMPANPSNTRRYAAKISKLEVGRMLSEAMAVAQEELKDISGDETVGHIMGIAEDAIFNFSARLNDTDNSPQLIGKGIYEYIKDLGENPIEQIGISTGFPAYDQAIGGGLRDGTLNVIGARPKTGKTLLSDNMGYHIAANLGIPVLNMDTEMQLQDHQHRTLAMMTECYIHDVETGKYYAKPDAKQKILEACTKLDPEQSDEVPPYHHISIAGMPFEEQLALMRRWVMKNVGFHSNGKAKPCVIVYDYLKLMDTKGLGGDMKEYQMLGFMMTSLHNFAVRYGIPFLVFMQLNRDGIKQSEGTDTAAGSDRIIWLCSNFTIFKKKSDEEIAEDGLKAGNRKLVPVVARHGGGLDGDYINCHMKGECAKITEGKTHREAKKVDTDFDYGDGTIDF